MAERQSGRSVAGVLVLAVLAFAGGALLGIGFRLLLLATARSLAVQAVIWICAGVLAVYVVRAIRRYRDVARRKPSDLTAEDWRRLMAAGKKPARPVNPAPEASPPAATPRDPAPDPPPPPAEP